FPEAILVHHDGWILMRGQVLSQSTFPFRRFFAFRDRRLATRRRLFCCRWRLRLAGRLLAKLRQALRSDQAITLAHHVSDFVPVGNKLFLDGPPTGFPAIFCLAKLRAMQNECRTHLPQFETDQVLAVFDSASCENLVAYAKMRIAPRYALDRFRK